jgi:hypothetical protein
MPSALRECERCGAMGTWIMPCRILNAVLDNACLIIGLIILLIMSVIISALSIDYVHGVTAILTNGRLWYS